MSNRIKENREKEQWEKEKWIVFMVFLLSLFLITVIFGWSTVYWAFGISLAVANLAIFWFKRERIYILGVIVMARCGDWIGEQENMHMRRRICMSISSVEMRLLQVERM